MTYRRAVHLDRMHFASKKADAIAQVFRKEYLEDGSLILPPHGEWVDQIALAIEESILVTAEKESFTPTKAPLKERGSTLYGPEEYSKMRSIAIADVIRSGYLTPQGFMALPVDGGDWVDQLKTAIFESLTAFLVHLGPETGESLSAAA